MTLFTEIQIGKLNQTIFELDEKSGVITTYNEPLVSLGQRLCDLYFIKEASDIVLKGPHDLSNKVAGDINSYAPTLYSKDRNVNIVII